MGSENLSTILQTTDLNPTDKIVYLTLASSATNGKAKLRIREIAFNTGLSDITVYQALKRLRARDMITSERVQHEKGKPNIYTIIAWGSEV
jgi:predicted transcriptional regulator